MMTQFEVFLINERITRNMVAKAAGLKRWKIGGLAHYHFLPTPQDEKAILEALEQITGRPVDPNLFRYDPWEDE